MKWNDWVFLGAIAGTLNYMSDFVLKVFTGRLPRRFRLRAPHWLHRWRAGRVRAACAESGDCALNIVFLSESEAMYFCRTHGLVSLYLGPQRVAALREVVNGYRKAGGQ